jgi:hypothetical protein
MFVRDRFMPILILVLIFFVAACANTPEKQSNSNGKVLGQVLLFDEKRFNEPSGNVRMLVTKDYLRIDSGSDHDDFLLFDRKTGIIYNVVVEDETVLVVENKTPIEKIPGVELNWRIEEEQSYAVMDGSGRKKSQFHRYYVNEKKCRSVVSVDKLLPEALSAVKEYREALARELAKGLQYQKAEDVCYLANNIVEPNRHLEQGFPIREWDEAGYQRFLKDYQIGIYIPGQLFRLPQKYNRYQIK